MSLFLFWKLNGEMLQKKFTIHKRDDNRFDLPVNNSVQKAIDPKSSLNRDKRRHIGLQVPRIFPNFGIITRGRKMLKNYDSGKYQERFDPITSMN